MTDEQIRDSLAAGVMGWELEHDSGSDWWNTPDGTLHSEHWNPLTDDRDCMQVLDRMVEHCRSKASEYNKAVWEAGLNTHPNGYHVRFMWLDYGSDAFKEGIHVDADRKRAVCIAALKAKGLWTE